jgi:hypothetical protein
VINEAINAAITEVIEVFVGRLMNSMLKYYKKRHSSVPSIGALEYEIHQFNSMVPFTFFNHNLELMLALHNSITVLVTCASSWYSSVRRHYYGTGKQIYLNNPLPVVSSLLKGLL